MPCPAGIEINTCARMSLLIRRAPSAAQLTPQAQEMMKKIEGCLHCGALYEEMSLRTEYTAAAGGKL